MAPSVPRFAGVKKSSAPMAFNIFFRSSLADSERASIILYPLAAATMVSPMPVLPLVASRMILSFVSSPLSSAFSIIYSAVLSLMEPPGLKLSSFAKIVTFLFGLSARISTSGVFPIRSSIV